MKLFDKLMLVEACKLMLQQYVNKPWTKPVTDILPVLLKQMVLAGAQQIQWCREALSSSKRGAMCELQVSLVAGLQTWVCLCIVANVAFILLGRKAASSTKACKGAVCALDVS